MSTKTIHVAPKLFRQGGIERREDNTIRLSISSNEPYLRYDWRDESEFYEVLSHEPGDINLDRLKAGAALLYNHDRDTQLGGIRNPEISNGKCYVEAQLSSAPDVASHVARVREGLLKDCSVGYEISGDGVYVGEKDGKPIYRFKWHPFEASLCTIAADITVGVGRQRDQKPNEEPREILVDGITERTETEPTTKPQMKLTPGVRNHFMAADKGGTGGGSDEGGGTQAPVIDAKKEREEALRDYKARCKKINDFVAGVSIPAWKAKAQEIAAKHIDGDADFIAFHSEVLPHFTTETSLREQASPSGVIVIGERGSNGQRALSIGAQFVRSKDFTERGAQTGRKRSITIDTDCTMLGIRGKVAMATRAGFNSSDLTAVNVSPMSQMVGLGVQRLTVMDILAGGTTGAAAIPYPIETTLGTVDGVAQSGGKPMAGMVGERGLKPLWEPDITTETANVKKIAITTKVPDEFLADFPGFQSYIDERLPFMVDTRAEQQILYGDGVGNNIKGITTFAGVQTRAYATAWADTIRKAITDVEVGSFFTVDGIVMHPYDWEVASLEKDGEDRFIAGGPFYVPFSNGLFVQLFTYWGKPVVVTTACTVTQPIVGCFKLGAQFFLREGMRIETTNSNEDDFRRNLIAVRAEERGALAVYRPSSFLEVTGGPARA